MNLLIVPSRTASDSIAVLTGGFIKRRKENSISLSTTCWACYHRDTSPFMASGKQVETIGYKKKTMQKVTFRVMQNQ